MDTRQGAFYTVLNHVNTTGAGLVINCKDFQHIVFSIGTSGTYAGTIKCQGATAEHDSDVAFGSAASETNRWDYVAMANLNTKTVANGDTGSVWAGTDSVEQFEVDTNLLDYITLNVTAHSAGYVTATVRMADNA